MATMQESTKLLDQKLSSFLKVLAKHFPKIEENKREVHMIILLILHGHSLLRNDASLLETLHGQVRKSTLCEQNRNATLSTKQRVISLAFLVLFPYINDKLLSEAYYGKINLKFIKTAIKGVGFGYDTLHTINVIKHKSIAQHIGQLKIMSTSFPQMIKFNYPNDVQTNDPLKIMQKIVVKVLNWIQFGITLELYRNYLITLWSGELKRKRKEKEQKGLYRFPVPPRPPPIKKLQPLNRNNELCPICQIKPKFILCASCGYLVCDDCIKKEKCPITLQPTKRRDLNKLEDDHYLSLYIYKVIMLFRG